MVNKPGPLPQPKKGHKFSNRQKKLLQELPNSKTVTEAAIKAGYSPKTAGQGGHQAIKAMRGRIPDLMDRIGLSEEFLIERHLKRHLTKTRTVFVREEVIQKRATGTGKSRRVEEIVRHKVKKYTLEDNQVQLRAMEQAFLLHGSYAPRDPKEAAQFGVKVVVMNVRGPARQPIDIKPGMEIPPLEESNGHKKIGSKNGDRKD